MTSAPRAIIDHAALRHNLKRVREAAPTSRIWAVIKADAYGHGAAEVASSLRVEGLAIARLDEAQRLRATGEHRPLLIMSGVYSRASLAQAAELGCELALHDAAQAQMVEQAGAAPPLRVWLKVNTGMNRLGLAPMEAARWLVRLTGCTGVQGRPGLMTHLANADDPADPLSEIQCQRLRTLPGADTCPLNIGNSAGILGCAAARNDWVRPGIMLYGVSPFIGESGERRGLRPVMTLRAPLIAINHCQRGDRIGYGGSYRCPEDMAVGVIGIGYGDGYPRHAPAGTPVLLGGRQAPLIGRVSMDMITLDLRGLPAARLGEEAVLWGQGLPVEEIAAAAGTIAYELLSGVTIRVAREHID